MAGLAYDAIGEVLYGSTTLSGLLHTIDARTGEATLIGPLGSSLIHGLAFDHVSRLLYGTYGDSGAALYRINPATGQATQVGPLGTFVGRSILGLTFHPDTNVLYGSFSGPGPGNGGIVTINTSTGAATQVATLNTNIASLAFHPFTNVLYGVNNQGADQLYTIDVNSETVTLAGPTGLENNLGIEFVGYRIPEPAGLVAISWGFLVLMTVGRREAQASLRGR
jgi:hypothetical protein